VSVLVVDDNEDVLNLLGSFLRYHGADVATAAGGLEALAHLASSRAHVLVIDYTMPGMTGFELLALIRKLPGEAERPTPAILFTASGGVEDAAHAAGFAAYLVKPLDPHVLVAEIARVHHMGGPGRAPQPPRAPATE
jgi:two-component system CheB/CheR fusion protein